MHLATSARFFGVGGSCKSAKKILFEGSCESLAAKMGPGNPAPLAMRMLFVAVLLVLGWNGNDEGKVFWIYCHTALVLGENFEDKRHAREQKLRRTVDQLGGVLRSIMQPLHNTEPESSSRRHIHRDDR